MFLLIFGTVLLCSLLYKLAEWLIHRNDGYWKERGIPVIHVSEYTSWMKLIFGRTNLIDLDFFYYKKYPEESVVGLMEFNSPVLLVRDLDLAKQIYVKDFEYFLDRRSFSTGDELTQKFLFNMKGHEWKDNRAAMSPVFTTNKIRRMFPHMEKSTAQFKEYVEEKRRSGGSDDIELRDLFGRYTMDVISGTAFGLDSRCLTDADSTFMKMGRKLQASSVWRTIKVVFALFIPSVFKLTGLSAIGDKESMAFFKSIVRSTVEKRQNKKGEFFDFVAAFVEQIEGKGKVEEVKDKDGEVNDAFEKDALIQNADTKRVKIGIEEITANSMGFFFAGFDTTESLLTLAAYHMAIDQEMQEKAREEIDRVSAEFGGKITYDGIAKMNYLDMLVHETLRLYPVATRTERKVSKEWKLPGTDVVLPVGMIVAMPIYGIHQDEKYFPNPKKFDPERFSPENKQKRHPYAWMPFGHGPRGCIAMRFALIEAKAAIAHLVKNFELRPCKDTWVPLQFDNIPGTLKPKAGLKVAMKPRE